jgi:hypothetical protein
VWLRVRGEGARGEGTRRVASRIRMVRSVQCGAQCAGYAP